MTEEEPNLFRPLTKESLEAGKTKDHHDKQSDDEVCKFIGNALKPDESLEQCQLLPAQIRQLFPPSLSYQPLQDVDPYYRNKQTFIVVNKSKNIFRFSATNALWILNPLNPIRRGTINLLIHPLFSLLIITTILINCVFMVLPDSPTVDIAEYVFIGIYTFEAVVKITARGLILDPFTYFRDPWNWLDFIILVLAYMTIGIDVGSLSGLRAFRVLRALKTVAIVPGLRLVVGAIFESVKNLRNVIILTTVSLFVFALVGLQIYMGALTQKCIKVFPDDGSWGNLTNENWDSFCRNETNWYDEGDSWEYPVCGNFTGASHCEPGYVCLQGYGPNPNYGYTNFDSFGWALLSALRLWTLDYWENLYHLVLKSSGPWHVLFFMTIIFTGSFYLMALFLTVIAISYAKVHKKIMKEKENEEEVLKKNKAGIENALKTNDIPYIESPDQTNNDNLKEVNVYKTIPKEDELKPTTKSKALDCLLKGVDFCCVWDCCGVWVKFQHYVALIAFDPFTELFVIICIILNTLFMALDHHDMDRDMETLLKNGNYFFTAVYIMEALLKIIALSPKHYFKVGWNIFDFVIVVLCLMELGLEGIQGLSVLRAFRLLRVLRLAKSWPTLNSVITVMGKTIDPLGNLTVVFVIIIFIFAVTGMQLFGENYMENIDRFPEGEIPRWNFIDFMHSFMVVHRAICGEWIESMWDCMLVGDVSCVPYFVATATIGKLVLSSFFILLILSDYGLSSSLTQTPDQDTTKLGEAFNRITRLLKRNKKPIKAEDAREDKLDRSKESITIDAADKDVLNETSSYSKNKMAKFRKNFSEQAAGKYFDIFIIAVIVISSLTLIMEDMDLISDPLLQENILLQLDRVFTIIFLIEIVIRITALGFKKYFTNPWCCLDFIIVMLSIMSNAVIVSADDNILAFRSILAVRALRPLRLFSRWERLRVVVSMVATTIWSASSVLLVCLFFWLIFAIMGVQLFAGKFYKCVDDNNTILNHEFIPDRFECMTLNYTWVNSPINFDNVGNAYLSLFQVATFKGWIQIMNDAVDSTEVGRQPIREVNIYMYFYFIVFINFGSFYTLYLVVVAIINNFRQKKKNVGSYLGIFMTENQTRNYMEKKKMRFNIKLQTISRPEWQSRAKVFDIVTHKRFDSMMMWIICLNLLTLSLDHYNQSETLSIVIDYLSLLFVLIFAIECIMKIFALGYRYFMDPWNVFDFVVLILTIVELVLSDFVVNLVPSSMLRIIRLARLFRILRLVKCLDTAASMQYTLTTSLPAVFNICLVLLVTTVVYAVLGMSFFKHIKNKGGIDDVINFKTLGQSMILLFQMSTFGGWDGVLDGIMNEEDCDKPNIETHDPGNCGSEALGILYIISYLIISFFIIAHMYLAVILENYFQVTEEDEERTIEISDMYHEIWKQFDPENTQYIHFDKLSDFLDVLEPPLRIPKPNVDKIKSMDIAEAYGDRIPCERLLDILKSFEDSSDLEEGRTE